MEAGSELDDHEPEKGVDERGPEAADWENGSDSKSDGFWVGDALPGTLRPGSASGAIEAEYPAIAAER